MKEKNREKKRLGALDVMLLVIILAIAASVAVRFISQSRSGAGSEAGKPLEDHIISFSIENIRHSSAENCMHEGDLFYLKEDDSKIGPLREDISIRVAEMVYEAQNGELVRVTTTGEGDLYRVDVNCSMSCVGRMAEDGTFYLNGSKPLAVNQEIQIYSKYLMVKAKISDISTAE